MRVIVLGMLLALATAAPATAGGGRWHRVTSSAGRFSIAMPGPMRSQQKLESTPAGAIRQNFFRARQKSEEYTVEYQDVPGLARLFKGRRGIVKKAGDGYIQRENVRVLSERDISAGPRIGREVTFQDPQGRIGKLQVFMIGSRLYIITATAKRGAEANRDFDRYFSSLKVWKKGSIATQ